MNREKMKQKVRKMLACGCAILSLTALGKAQEVYAEESARTLYEQQLLHVTQEELENDPLAVRYVEAYQEKQQEGWHEQPVLYTALNESYGAALTHNIRFDDAKKIYGVDVSKWQADIDWDKVRDAGIEYAILRVGYRSVSSGEIYLDEWFKENIKEAHRVGLDVGVYFYTQALDKKEATAEAKFVVEQLKPYSSYITLPVYYDIEAYAGSRLDNSNLTKEQKTANTEAFCTTVEKAGYKAGVYSNKNYLIDCLYIEKLAKKYEVWLAHYINETNYEGEYTIWQYTSSGKVNGIQGNVDMNVRYHEDPEVDDQYCKPSYIYLELPKEEGIEGYDITVYDLDGTEVMTAATMQSSYAIEGLSPATYRIKTIPFVIGDDGIKIYDDTKEKTQTYRCLKKVKKLTADINTQNMTLKWSAVAGSDGYRIWRYSESLQRYYVYADTDTNSFPVKNSLSNAPQRFQVQAYVEDEEGNKMYGKASNSLTCQLKFTQLENFRITAVGDTTMNFRWNRKPGAKKYCVLRFTMGGNLIDRTFTNTTSVQVKGLKPGTEYQFKACAVGENSITGVSYGVGTPLLQMKSKPSVITDTVATAATTTTSVALKWSAKTGADGYNVYQYNAAAKKYDLVGRTKRTSYTVKDLKVGTRYTFRVAGYSVTNDKQYVQKYGNQVSVATRPSDVSGFKMEEASMNSVRLSWDKVTGASGYHIKVYDVNGKLVKDTRATRPITVVAGLSSKTKYTCSVRAYIKRASITSYSTNEIKLNVTTK